MNRDVPHTGKYAWLHEGKNNVRLDSQLHAFRRLMFGKPMTQHSEAALNRWGSIASLVGLILTMATVFAQVNSQSHSPTATTWSGHLTTLLFLGLVSAILYGVLWTTIQKTFHWDFGENTSMPKDIAAVALSVSMTLPITVVPPLYQTLTGDRVISTDRYIYAAFLLNISSAIAYIVWYGSDLLHFRGIRNITFPVGAAPDRKRYAIMEALATCMHFLSTVAVYRIAADNQQSLFGPSSVAMPTILSAAFFFFGICLYSFVKYPASLADSTWAQVRGVLAAALLSVTVTAGMLM